jgi:hypothetical protein
VGRPSDTTTRAPYALRTLRLSSLTLSGQTKTHEYPLACATIARPTPVLPDVGSTIVPPGLRSPDFSAASTMRSAMRSFTEPPGFMYSILASTVPRAPPVVPPSFSSGVFPTSSRSVST